MICVSFPVTEARFLTRSRNESVRLSEASLRTLRFRESILFS